MYIIFKAVDILTAFTRQQLKHVPPVLNGASGGIPSLRIARRVPPMPGNHLF
jgi:hypothetical protein